MGFLCLIIQKDHINGAVPGTQAAADAPLLINGHHTVFTSVNGLGRADRHAVCLFTLVADLWHMVEFFLLTEDGQSGKPWIVSAKQVK